MSEEQAIKFIVALAGKNTLAEVYEDMIKLYKKQLSATKTDIEND